MCYLTKMNNFISQSIIFFIVFIYSFFSYSHGEEKPGPHQGHIRMPGAFHTELVISSDQKIKIYLLDMNWQNPTVKNSNVIVTYKAEKPEKAKCSVTSDHFTCEFSKKVDLTKIGVLNIKAVREGNNGTIAIYELPLSHKH